MDQSMKKRFYTLFGVFGTVFQYGFIPTVIFLGLRKGADPGCPELTFMSLLWQ